ncbi:MBL fold metallo-hydrolase [Paenibacillus filicis]|uniref:MBL fold metallo-hydrolase n=1 Tax=Paenibacillus gyeongsangnamensis TaxID=3388067 RepID=A0ABT4Q2J7_9BACL|nr:MBL fold metallo-hydrolase [Paenibacillus filicis]MCZ8511103.1 MBL fold metallo-hydrolase [Paenibacillus filicis]
MNLTFLGTGDFYPRSLGHNSALLEWNDTRLMIDCPASNASALERLGLGLHEVTNMFVTHLHEDHINGIQQFAYWHEIHRRMHGNDAKPSLYIVSDLIGDLWSSVRSGLSLTTGGVRELEHYFELRLIDSEDPVFELSGVRFECVRTRHVPSMVSYGLWAKPYFHFSGDALADSDLLGRIEPAVERIFHDCHLWDLTIASHASLADLRSLPEPVRRKLVLMHYNYNYETAESREAFERREGLPLAAPLQSFAFA